MAGEWLKFEKATPEKPEVFAMAARLEIDSDAVVGKLIRLWSWFDTHTIDGNGRSVTPASLDRIAGVSGFAMAMVNVGWLVVSDDGVSLPNFGHHTGETAKARALTAKRVADHKGRSNAKGNADSVSAALPREEKSREEERAEAGDACPHAEIIDLYHELLPANPRIKAWTGARQANLRTRWREDAKRQSLDYWRRFFGHVAGSPFLTGQKVGPDGRPFLPGLDWLVKPDNFAKVIESRYHDKGAQA